MRLIHAAVVGSLFSLPLQYGFAQQQVPPAHPAPSQAGAANSNQTDARKDEAQKATVAAANADNGAHYIIGPEDMLQITVWKEPTLSGSFPVRPDGRISMALVGDLPAAGRTPMALADEITQRLKKYLQDPNVSVVVQGVNSQRIYLMGEVGHVGPIPLTANMSPLQAIATAGGLSPFAKSKKIYVLRIVNGKDQKIPFNYKQALKGDEFQGIKLQPGDTIVVP